MVRKEVWLADEQGSQLAEIARRRGVQEDILIQEAVAELIRGETGSVADREEALVLLEKDMLDAAAPGARAASPWRFSREETYDRGR